ncbi:Type cbb3 cytochrome oxidase biogenesis protein CcoG, involved in Cu oxidation [Rubellimicrobium mesophilum DSM 19309]|uniref:Type cbb3 cytochrome oxidase biogenesis protein CcoG, involved in Cu oxidation n=1 Tax=Rubellimicrobium mesophilum DSM 19309 TaxID=442562 RepID=A0A017HMY9_9RHOB|nr:cytochrome c oxidase accessory protein CcoG [Rubellimicrobium mesophilum]EYD75680.1 Type cbb3 cytochrome oxidase biogenesis protein CcoG, involved in Cu oxidation [Rubellimicrobium mesophilum DSM 19309]
MSQSSTPSLYAAREPVFPRRVKGKFRTLKWVIMAITLGIYYLLPWVRWDRGPELPDQAVLVDMAGRRFFFFWIEIWPHEFYFVAGLLIMAGLGLFLFTSALGRVWCGYACPQTVWTDLFILTERWVEGDRNARVRLWNAPWSLNKARLRIIKWTIWLAIGIATGGAWVFYFADAPTLLMNLLTGQAHPVAYMTVATLTATTFLFGGFFREQICIYACPWPRIQSAMMDEETITIGYRDWRGEPRGRGARTPRSGQQPPAFQALERMAAPGTLIAQGAAPVAKGDCVDCMACVNVCPMGIDIRNGQQMECITCGLCIDACDDVMSKLGLPRGLIDYFTLQDEQKERAGGQAKAVWRHILRPRTILYTSMWSAIGVGLLVALFIRADIDISVAPVRNPVYITLSDGTIRNAYDLRLRNKNHEPREFALSYTAHAPLNLHVEGVEGISVTVPADETTQVRLYLDAAAQTEAAEAEHSDVRLWVTDITSGERASAETHFNGVAQDHDQD